VNQLALIVEIDVYASRP